MNEISQGGARGAPAVGGLDKPVGHARLVVAAALLCVAVFGVARIADPNMCDDGLYLTAGWRVSQGDVLYRDIVDNHPPLMLWLIAGVMRVAGPSVIAVRGAFLTAHLAALIFIFLLVRRIHSEQAGALAALFYGCDPFMLGQAPRLTVMLAWVVILWAPALYFYARGSQEGRLRWIAIAGILAGLSVMVKQPGLLIFPMVAWFELCMGGDASPRARAARLAGFAAWAALPILLILLLLAGQGTLGAFWTYAYRMNSLDPFGHLGYRLRYLMNAHMARSLLFGGAGLLCCWTIFAAGGRSDERRHFNPTRSRLFMTLIGWWLINVAFLMLTERLHDHYMIPVYFCFALMAATAVATLSRGFALDRKGLRVSEDAADGRRVSGWSIVIAVLLIVFSLRCLGPEREILSSGRVPGVSAQTEREIGNCVRNMTSPDDRIFCFANPVFYLESGRRPATKYAGVFGVFLSSRISGEYEKTILDGMADERTRVVLVGKKYLHDPDFGKGMETSFMKQLKKYFRLDRLFTYAYDGEVELWVRKASPSSE